MHLPRALNYREQRRRAPGTRLVAGTWDDGRYTVSLETPQRTYACSLQVPVDLPVAPEWSKPLSCTAADAEGKAGRLAGSFQRYTACEQPRGLDPKSRECGRAADHFMLRARFDDLLPDTLTSASSAKASLYEELRTVRYEEWYPNGPECDRDPCRSSNVDFTMP